VLKACEWPHHYGPTPILTKGPSNRLSNACPRKKSRELSLPDTQGNSRALGCYTGVQVGRYPFKFRKNIKGEESVPRRTLEPASLLALALVVGVELVGAFASNQDQVQIEAKNDNLRSGLGQCIAAMFASQL
jgi:hypothetical protein